MEADTKTVLILYRFPVPGNTTVQSGTKSGVRLFVPSCLLGS